MWKVNERKIRKIEKKYDLSLEEGRSLRSMAQARVDKLNSRDAIACVVAICIVIIAILLKDITSGVKFSNTPSGEFLGFLWGFIFLPLLASIAAAFAVALVVRNIIAYITFNARKTDKKFAGTKFSDQDFPVARTISWVAFFIVLTVVALLIWFS